MNARTTLCLVLVVLGGEGCADLTVTNVVAHPDAKGVRYSLPKPILQAVPQADGTIAVDVLYLPDGSNTYAVDTSSIGSSYTFQITRAQNSLLSAIEFKADTSAIGQQLAATTGAATAQILNVQNAQRIAAQTAVNTAQTAVDAAKTAVDAAAAQLDSDTANNVSTKINDDKAALAQAQAKLQDAQLVLDRAKGTAQAVTVTASIGTPTSTTGPTPGTGFGAQTWAAAAVYELPTSLGSVIYAINDYIDPASKKEIVSLTAQTFSARDSIQAAKQQVFDTTTIALGQATLGPQGLTYSLTSGPVKFVFNREVKSVDGSLLKTADDKPVAGNVAAATLDKNDHKTVTQDVGALKAGSYILTIQFTDDLGKIRIATVKFTLS